MMNATSMKMMLDAMSHSTTVASESTKLAARGRRGLEARARAVRAGRGAGHQARFRSAKRTSRIKTIAMSSSRNAIENSACS